MYVKHDSQNSLWLAKFSLDPGDVQWQISLVVMTLKLTFLSAQDPIDDQCSDWNIPFLVSGVVEFFLVFFIYFVSIE